MNKTINNLISPLEESPRKLFLIDASGAALTALILFVIMRHFNHYFGMPKTVLAYLCTAAVCFCLYSSACFLFLKRRRALFIRVIGLSNLLYCALIIGLLIKYFHLLTLIGTAYFLIETAIICALGCIELNTAKEIQKRAPHS